MPTEQTLIDLQLTKWLWLRVLILPTLVMAILSFWDWPCNAQSSLDSWDQTVVNQAVARVSDAVVQIETIGGLDRIRGTNLSSGPTTGTIVSQDGFVLTSSFNLLQQPSAIFVKLADGTRLPAEIVSRNESRQVVLLKIRGNAELAVPNFIDRSQTRVGQTVVAVGKVFDASQPNISTGILSAKNRIWGKAIQTDAKISPSNFGGPLIDLEGHLLGILVPLSPTTSKISGGSEWYDSGIGFAVPLNELRLDQMAAGESLRDGLIGVTFKEDNGYASPAVIAACPRTSPAAKAGMLPGDRVTKINDVQIHRVNEAKHALGPLYAGDEIKITVERSTQTLDFDVQMVAEIQPFRHSMIGILPRLDSELGIVVREVIQGSGAEQAGIQAGDRIISINQHPIDEIDALEGQMMKMSKGETIELEITRQQQPQQLSVTLDQLHSKLLSANPSNDATPDLDSESVVEIKIPEQPNDCFAYIPIQDGRPLGLLIWIGPPGNFEPQKKLAKWKSWCDQHRVAVVLPKSRTNKAWLASELEFLTKATQQVITDHNINSRTIAVGGENSGGVLASMFALTQRSLIRGLILKDAPISKRVEEIRSDAVHRLLVLLIDTPNKNHADEVIQSSEQTLANNGFPVFLYRPQHTGVNHEIVGWVKSLDRY